MKLTTVMVDDLTPDDRQKIRTYLEGRGWDVQANQRGGRRPAAAPVAPAPTGRAGRRDGPVWRAAARHCLDRLEHVIRDQDRNRRLTSRLTAPANDDTELLQNAYKELREAAAQAVVDYDRIIGKP